MSSNKTKEPFLKDKPHMLSFFVAFSVLITVYTLMSFLGILGDEAFNELNILGLGLTVAISCFLMSLTDKLNVSNNFIIGLIDIGDIVVSVFSVNFIAAFIISNDGLFFGIADILIVLGTIIITYSAVCLVFYISGISSERKINEKINIMKQEVNKVEQNNRGK